MSGGLGPRLDRVLAAWFGPGSAGLAPSAVLLVARGGQTLYEAAVGDAGPETVFDLASVTKAAATAPLLMKAVESGLLRLDQPLVELLPEWERGPLREVSLRQLLSHRAGLWEWRPVYSHSSDPRLAIDFVLGLEPRHRPGTVRAYSDLGLMVAGEILRRASGSELDDLFADWLAGPLGLERTAFRPSASWPVAPTSLGDWYERRMLETRTPYPVPESAAGFLGWRTHLLRGEANDGNAFHAFAGVAGHAGLFSGAAGLARLGAGLADGSVVSRATLLDFMREEYDQGQGAVLRIRSLGGRPAFWHPGFTGPRWLVEPQTGLVVVLLCNRLRVEGEPQAVDGAWDQVLAEVEAGLSRP